MVEKKKYEEPKAEVVKLDAAVRICSSSVTNASATEEYEEIETTDWWN